MKDDSTAAAGAGPSATLSALAGLAIVFTWPLVLLIPGVSTHQITDIHDDIVGLCAKWLVVSILCAIAFAIQRRPRADLGIRRLRWRDVLACFAGAIVGIVLSGAASRLVAMPSSVTDLQKLAAVPFGLRVAVVLTAAICEEFIYRGFAIEELAALTGGRWMAGILSLALFTVSHAGLYGFSTALIVPGIMGAVLTGLYLWRRNLPSCVLLHAIVDGLFVIVIPAAMHAR